MEHSTNLSLSMDEWKKMLTEKNINQYCPISELIERFLEKTDKDVLYSLLAKCYSIDLDDSYYLSNKTNALYTTLLKIYNTNCTKKTPFEEYIFTIICPILKISKL